MQGPWTINTLVKMARYFLGADGNLLIERRSTPRYEVDLEIEIDFAVGGSPIRGRTKNISESGAQIVLPREVRQGRMVGFECPSFGGSAQVVWSRDEGSHALLGLRFVSLTPKDRDALLAEITRVKRERSAQFVAARA